MNYNFLIGATFIAGASFIGMEIYKNEKNQKNKYRDKIKSLIIEKGDLDKDPHNRTIDDDVIDAFIIIANNHNIKLEDDINDKTFDLLYKTYVENLIIKHSKIK
jgi:hypothetical protein